MGTSCHINRQLCDRGLASIKRKCAQVSAQYFFLSRKSGYIYNESLCLGQALGVILIIEGRYPGIQAPQFMIYELLPFWLKCYLSWSLVQDFISPHPQVTSVRKSATARCYLEGWYETRRWKISILVSFSFTHPPFPVWLWGHSWLKGSSCFVLYM